MGAVKVVEHDNEADKDRHQGSGAEPPPDPPKRFATLEEANGVLEDHCSARASSPVNELIAADWLGSSLIPRVPVLEYCSLIIRVFAESIWRMENANTKDQAHKQAANM